MKVTPGMDPEEGMGGRSGGKHPAGSCSGSRREGGSGRPSGGGGGASGSRGVGGLLPRAAGLTFECVGGGNGNGSLELSDGEMGGISGGGGGRSGGSRPGAGPGSGALKGRAAAATAEVATGGPGPRVSTCTSVDEEGSTVISLPFSPLVAAGGGAGAWGGGSKGGAHGGAAKSPTYHPHGQGHQQQQQQQWQQQQVQQQQGQGGHRAAPSWPPRHGHSQVRQYVSSRRADQACLLFMV